MVTAHPAWLQSQYDQSGRDCHPVCRGSEPRALRVADEELRSSWGRHENQEGDPTVHPKGRDRRYGCDVRATSSAGTSRHTSRHRQRRDVPAFRRGRLGHRRHSQRRRRRHGRHNSPDGASRAGREPARNTLAHWTIDRELRQGGSVSREYNLAAADSACGKQR